MRYSSPMREILKHAALQLHEQFPVVLLKDGTKELAHRDPHPFSRREIEFWYRRSSYNIGILLGDGLMAVDLDARDEATLSWASANGISSPMIAISARGYHIYMRTLLTGQKTMLHYQSRPVDLKFTGYMVAPPSYVEKTQWRYRWQNAVIAQSELPFFPDQILRASPAISPVIRQVRSAARGVIRDPKAYVLKIPSIQGQNGSRGLVRAVCVLRDNGISSTEAFAFLMKEWRAIPPWSAQEIAYCINRHYGDQK